MSPVAYSPTSGATFLNRARATCRPQSSRMNARRAEALSSARLGNAVPGSSCPYKGPKSANSCSSNWSPGPRGKVLNTHCEGEKPPLRLRLFLVPTSLAIAIFMSSKHRTACSVIIRFNTALNNPPCRSTLPICSGLSTPAFFFSFLTEWKMHTLRQVTSITKTGLTTTTRAGGRAPPHVNVCRGQFQE